MPGTCLQLLTTMACRHMFAFNCFTGWDDVVKDCDYCMHLASPFVLNVDEKDADSLIKPAGTVILCTELALHFLDITLHSNSTAHACD
jgi:hypothetical protein